MKTIILLTIITCFLSGTQCYSQTITLSLKKVPLEKTFKEIRKQTGYTFVYTREQINKSNPVSIDLKDASLSQALDICFTNQPLTFIIEDKHIIVKDRPEKTNALTVKVGIDITGKVINEQNEPLAGATVAVEGTGMAMATDSKGEFGFSNLKADNVLLISSIGYQSLMLPVAGRSFIPIKLQISISRLDETIIKGYYTTSKRLNTGSVSKVTSEEIGIQPVSNSLAALEGRVPGLIVTQSSGISGSSYKLELRGKNSIAQGNDPFIVIDGVPFAPNNSNINQLGAAFTYGNNGLSALNSINPNDIESVEVLKDADATAIYGAKGANGVILITTKQGKIGETKTEVSINTGFSKITRSTAMMNTEQYLLMRREAFKNDNESMTTSNAFDLLAWDTTRYTDFKKLLIGGTAYPTDAQGSISGGTVNTQFLIGGSYHRETTVFPGNSADSKSNFHFNIKHSTTNQRFLINLTGTYGYEKNNIIQRDLTNNVNLPPDLPSLYDFNGNLNWSSYGFSFNNPLASLKLSYDASVSNLLGNLQIQYKILPKLTFKTNLGYNNIELDEISTNPISAQNPAYNPTGYSQFGNSNFKSLIVEPQLAYQFQILKKGIFDCLIGASWQENINSTDYIFAYGYTNDALLRSLDAASGTSTNSAHIQYRYGAIFGRFNYTYDNKYVVNLTGRRDGSSRFGPENQFASFGAIGAVWIISKEQFFQKKLPFLSFGKIRFSYGTSGNDAIGDYKYLDTWTPTNLPYQGVAGLRPTGLFNSQYGWEINKKLEAALETGFLQDRIQLSISWYRNRSSNQLISYKLPSQTGFSSVIKNLPALIQNKGWEFEFNSVNIKSSAFSWMTTLTFSFPDNKLLSFPGLSTSSYKSDYKVGLPLNIATGFKILGVDPQTGIYQFAGKDGSLNNSPSYPDDLYVGIGKIGPKFYGGFQNKINFKEFSFELFFEFRKQMGYNYFFMNSATPGTAYNQPSIILNRWQKPGDKTEIEQFSQSYSNPAYLAYLYANVYGASNAITDASFIRLKNIAFSYELPKKLAKKAGLASVIIDFQAQNLFLLTKYKGTDPETQAYSYLPPLKTIVGGIKITF